MLYEAALQGNPDLIRLLLVYESEVDARDSHGSTHLHVAMAAGHERAMWALVGVGQADISAPDAQGFEPPLQGYLALRSLRTTRRWPGRSARLRNVLAWSMRRRYERGSPGR